MGGISALIMELILKTREKKMEKMGVGRLVIAVTPIEPHAGLRPFLSVNGWRLCNAG